MIEELKDQPDPDGAAATLLDSIDLIVPHQANKTMVIKLAGDGRPDPRPALLQHREVGNTSAASIPLAIADAKADGVIDRPIRVFAPGFGAGAVGGYAVLRVDPGVIVVADGASGDGRGARTAARTAGAPARDRRPRTCGRRSGTERLEGGLPRVCGV